MAGLGDVNLESVEDSALASISVSSVPQFWEDHPRLWFIRFEASLYNLRISDDLKQSLLIPKLTTDPIREVYDLLLALPETQKYQTLKDRLLKVYEARQLQLLLKVELGSQKPSELLRRMKALAGTKIPDSILKIMWSTRLPTAVQAILAAVEGDDLDNLADIADKIMEVTKPEKEVINNSSPSLTDLAAEVKKLSIKVNELCRSQQRERRSRRRSRSKSRTRDVGRGHTNSEPLCFYHYRYRHKAIKCVKPCSWNSTVS